MITERPKIKLFIDFDGTIINKDVGAELFLKYGNSEIISAIIADITNKVISGREGWERLFANTPPVTFGMYDDIISSMELRPGFKEFIGFSISNSLDVIILSDGFTYYIDNILTREGFKDLKYFANELAEEEGAGLKAVFPYTDEECTLCANCKRNHIISNSAEDDITVYIGNGSSDTCPVQYVDIIFARDSLLRFCERNRISYYPFDTFFDVERIIKNILAKKRIKKRRQAELKRKQVYSLG